MDNTSVQFSALASYRNNALFTTLPEIADLALVEDPELDCKVAADVFGLHVHEYIHQLHNFSTTAGLQLLKNRLVALRFFATGTDDNGHYIRQGKTYSVNKEAICNFENDYIKIIGNTGKMEVGGFLSEFGFDFFDTLEPTEDPTDPYQILGVRLKFKLAGAKHEIDIDNIGYNIITEGIAYEIEREVRNNINSGFGAQLDYNTPVLPYRLYRPIVEELVGRVCTVEELVKVGTFALQNKIPSLGLKAAAGALRYGVLSQVTTVLEADFQEAVISYRTTIDLLLKTTFVGSAVKIGLKLLDSIVMGAINKRLESPYYELEFLCKPLTLKVFKAIIRDQDLPARCILQSKPDGSAELFWMGNEVGSLSDVECGAIATLQCTLQYSQLHLSSKGCFNNTVELLNSPNNLSCPYLNACPLREKQSDPMLCATSPWMHDMGIQSGDVCWYVNGIKSVRNSKFMDYDVLYS